MRAIRPDRIHLCIVAMWLAGPSLGGGVLAQNGLPRTISGPSESGYFGHGVASGGDANGDGFDDVFVTDKLYQENNLNIGRSIMISGRDGRELWRFVCLQPPSGVPYYLAPAFIGDIDGDHNDDVILAQPSSGSNAGRVDVFSGSTGDILFSYVGAETNDRLGRDASGVGDVDGDGVPDFGFVSKWLEAGAVSIRSGRDGSEIFRIERPWPRCVARVGDIDGDQHDDFAVGSYQTRGLSIAVYSGADSSIIYDLDPPNPGDTLFGWKVIGGYDLTGDLVPDFVASGNGYGAAYLFDGATGLIATTLRSTSNSQVFGVTLSLADIDGDGAVEVCIGDHHGLHAFDAMRARELGMGPPATVENSIFFGTEYATGDVNGDGRADLISGQYTSEGGTITVSAGAPLLLSPTNALFTMRRGRNAAFTLYSGEPARRLYLLASRRGTSCTFIPYLNICIDLLRPIENVSSAVTDADGFATVSAYVPNEIPLGPVWLQAIDRNSPLHGAVTSNVLSITITE